jgi:hypothetical protein
MTDWHAVLRHLEKAEEALDGAHLSGYVDVSSGEEALSQLVESAQWWVFETAGRPVPGNSSLVEVDGRILNFTEFWEEYNA